MKTHDFRRLINHDSEFLTILRHLPALDSEGPWVAGGSVWKSIENRPIESDIDFFFKSPQQCEQWFRTLLSMPYVQRIVSEPKANDYNTTLQYHVHSRGFNKTVKLQLISFSFYKDVEDLFNNFDFTVCQFAFDGQTLFSGDTSLDDLRNREIIFNKVRDNYATMVHLEKYLKHGFVAPLSQKQRFEEIMSLRKKSEEKMPDTGGPRLWSASISPEPLRATRSSDEEDVYPRPTNIEENQGINLVRATQIPRRPVRQEQPRSIWDSVPSAPVEASAYATTTINTSYYTTATIQVDMAAGESQSSQAYVGDIVSDGSCYTTGATLAESAPNVYSSPGISVREIDNSVNPLSS